MRKITAPQIMVFSLLSAAILTLGVATAWYSLRTAPLGDFRAVAILAVAIGLVYAYAIVVYRAILTWMPLPHGAVPPGSRAEFVAQLYILFYLMYFNALIRTHIVPIPLLRLLYAALGARLGPNSYSAGVMLDPPLTTIGSNTILGHDALVFAHVIEGGRFEFHPVTIGSDVTVGGNSVIMPGAEIGNGAIVSIGAVVTKGTRIATGEIWAGVPAHCIGHRKDYPGVRSGG